MLLSKLAENSKDHNQLAAIQEKDDVKKESNGELSPSKAPNIPGLNLDKIKNPGAGSPESNSEKIDEQLVQKMKKVFNLKQLDLTDDNNYTLMLQIFRQERNLEGKREVLQQRNAQLKKIEQEKRFYQAKAALYPRKPSVGGRSSALTPLAVTEPRNTSTRGSSVKNHSYGINNSQFNVTHPAGLWHNQIDQNLTDNSIASGTQAVGWMEKQAKLRMRIEEGRIFQNSFGYGHGFPIEGKESSTRNDWTTQRHASRNKYLDPIGNKTTSDFGSVNIGGHSKRSASINPNQTSRDFVSKRGSVSQYASVALTEAGTGRAQHKASTIGTSRFSVSPAKRDEMYRKYATPVLAPSLRPGIKDVKMPQIDFSRINRLRVKHNAFGTGKEVREELLAHGGAAKFFRTKRQNNIINKPLSMFESTHLQTSSRAQEISDPMSTTQVVLDLDTSFCERYDEAGAPASKLQTISQHLQTEQEKAFDYFYAAEEEGTSPRNLKRRILFKGHIDHLNNPNKILTDKMKDFYKQTKGAWIGYRDTGIQNASKHMEREQLKLKQIHRQITTIQAYRDELAQKEAYLKAVKQKYPHVPFGDHAIHSYTFDEMKFKISQMLEFSRFTGAAIKIQRFWMKKIDIFRYERSIESSVKAARYIQKAWRRASFVTHVNKLVKRRKDESVARVQKYIRGYLSRRSTLQYFKDVKINGNLQPMVDLRKKMREDASILIRYYWKRYKARKAAKKKKAAAKKKKGSKFGRK